MDIGLFRGLVTVVLFIAFCGVVIWAYSGRRKKSFDEAARLPLEQDTKAERDDG